MPRTPQPLVTTRAGMLAGTRLVDAGLPAIDVYKGVPYAARPVGPLRWQAPQPLAPWVGVRSALQFGPDCPQPPSEPSRATRQAEDCLYLNVWTPADAACGSLPVMVWLHGGSFVGGSGSDPRSDGASLAREGVVVVTLNYRVGVFGFLAHPALSAESPRGVSGNHGLLDQLCALRWVREHIGRFGGDASRITLFGSSAGASSIALLMASPLAVGLFQRAILQSPGVGRPLASLAQAESAGQALGDLDALRAMGSDELLALTARVAPLRSLRAARLLRPIVDGAVVLEDERPAWRSGRLRSMPLLIGGNTDEGSMLTARWPIDTLSAYRELLAKDFGAAAASVEAMYAAPTDAQVRGRVAELFADTQFNAGVRRLALTMAQQGAPTWRYLYTHRRAGQHGGPHHTDEIADVFGTAEDAALSTRMRRAWAAFATTGNPNHDGLGCEWAPCEPSNDRYIEFGDTTRMANAARSDRLDLLDRLFDAAPR